jgi:hypothetical protein
VVENLINCDQGHLVFQEIGGLHYPKLDADGGFNIKHLTQVDFGYSPSAHDKRQRASNEVEGGKNAIQLGFALPPIHYLEIEKAGVEFSVDCLAAECGRCKWLCESSNC